MQENTLLNKATAFATRIIKLVEYLDNKKRKAVTSNQILKSGTSIGANISESVYASSKADFINKLSIAQKEASETQYWLVLLKSVDYIEEKIFHSLAADIEEILKLLASSIKTARQ